MSESEAFAYRDWHSKKGKKDWAVHFAQRASTSPIARFSSSPTASKLWSTPSPAPAATLSSASGVYHLLVNASLLMRLRRPGRVLKGTERKRARVLACSTLHFDVCTFPALSTPIPNNSVSSFLCAASHLSRAASKPCSWCARGHSFSLPLNHTH